MKTKSIKAIAISTLILFTVTACTNNQKSSDNNSKNKKEEVKAPKMDLHTAVFMENTVAIQQHIKFGSDLNIKEPMGGSTPLISASLFGKIDIALLLIDSGADLNAINNEGSTALHTAAFFCHTQIVEALLQNNADKSIKNKDGATAYDAVNAPFNQTKPIYDFFAKELGPLGLKIDFEHLEKSRPIIKDMLE